MIPGPRTAEWIPALRRYESRNVTHVSEDFPVFWESAGGATVVDVDGNRYLDLAAAFGVANAGHSNPRVVAAIAEQAARLMHGMGDVHPTAPRARLLERLGRTFAGVAGENVPGNHRVGGRRSRLEDRDAGNRTRKVCRVSRRVPRPFPRNASDLRPG